MFSTFPRFLSPILKFAAPPVSVTLETGGGGLPQREEDVAHDGGTANSRGGDDVEDAVDVLTKVFLRVWGTERSDGSTNTHKLTHKHALTLLVSKFSDSLSFTGSISQGLCSVQICYEFITEM